MLIFTLIKKELVVHIANNQLAGNDKQILIYKVVKQLQSWGKSAKRNFIYYELDFWFSVNEKILDLSLNKINFNSPLLSRTQSIPRPPVSLRHAVERVRLLFLKSTTWAVKKKKNISWLSVSTMMSKLQEARGILRVAEVSPSNRDCV